MSWRVALRLGRVSNLPTVWTNVAAGMVLAGGSVAPVPVLLLLLIALSLLYIGGMYLNDAFDRHFDARERPTRPIPSGEVTAAAVFVVGFAVLALGQVPLIVAGYCLEGGQGGLPVMSGLVLAGAIVYYDARHKGNPLSPLVMGMCRALVYVTAAVAVTSRPPQGVYWGATVLLAYVIGVTGVAQGEEGRHRTASWALVCLAAPFFYAAGSVFDDVMTAAMYLGFLGWTLRAVAILSRRDHSAVQDAVTSLIAGISLLDGLLMAGQGSVKLAPLVAICGVALTRVLQRRIPGT